MSSPTDSANRSASWSSNACNSRSRRRNRKLMRHGASGSSFSGEVDSLSLEKSTVPEENAFVYSHPKPQVITGALFMWEEVASYCEPRQVCELERLSKDVAAHLEESNTSTHMMQRYWNAQWLKLIWDEGLATHEKRFLLPSSLSRSKGKINWKKCFVEEYPLWLQRTIMGKGNNDSAYDASKVLFHRELLNEHISGDKLAAMELTVEEAIAKALAKRGIEAEKDEVGLKHLLGDQKNGLKRRGEGGVGSNGTASLVLGKGRSCVNLCYQPSQENFIREDYQLDHRQGSRKGKHKKGMDKKWSSYDNFGDYDY